MPNRRNRTLHGRANQAGILFAAANAPVTFERTLMPRGTMDQALVTGLSAAANHALISLVQESIQAAALVASGQGRHASVDDGRWSRATIVTDLAAIGVGIAVQRVLSQQDREPLTRAGGRTGGFWLSVAGATGGIAGILHEVVDNRKGRASFAVNAAAAAALAGGNTWLVRKRSRLDADLPPEESQASLAKSLGIGLGVVAGMSAFGVGERKLADVVSRALARVLPGDAAIWRPVGHAAALAGFGAAARYIAVTGLHRIEGVNESAQAAFDISPPNPFVSGSYESLVPFETLSRAGARYVWTATSPDLITEVMGESPKAVPIRAYVGLESAPTEQERVDLLMRELERTNAFDRSWLMVASPTGTGYVNYAAVSILEFLTRGDCATMAMQYSARPSPLSLDRVSEGRKHMRMIAAALRDRLAQCPEGRRPKVLLFGESLGAWTSQDAFVNSGTQGLIDAGFDFAIWIGTPHFSKWKERVLYDDRPDVDRDLIGVFDHVEELESLDPEMRERLRFVMITHNNDGVGAFGPELLIQAPPWLGKPETRHATVPKGMRWTPTTGFFQVLVDMKNAANVVPGVFAATGHDYRADLLPFFNAVLGLPTTPEQVASIGSWLEARETLQSQWMKAHGAVNKSLAATVLQRLMQEERDAGRDPDERLIQVFRTVAREEFGVTEGIAAPARLRARVRRPPPLLVELAAVGSVALYNVVSHRHVGRRARLATNVGAAAALVGLARSSGLGGAELGLEPDALRRGVRVGVKAAVPIVAGVAAAVAVPTTRALLADEQITGTGRAEAAFETFVRIPLETALAEEIIFRGVLLGIALRARTPLGAVVSSSAWFGLWHVYPTLGSLACGTGGHFVGEQPHRVGGATAGVVLSTAAAGAVFAGLRLRSGSVAAPVIAHAALNMAAFAGVRITRAR